MQLMFTMGSKKDHWKPFHIGEVNYAFGDFVGTNWRAVPVEFQFLSFENKVILMLAEPR